jgi:cellulase/cellobiase CelA1
MKNRLTAEKLDDAGTRAHRWAGAGPQRLSYFWIKRPGESDGTCNGGPPAGQWWADYALGLAQRAAY